MKLIIYADICSLTQPQLRAIEHVAIAHDATLEKVIGLDHDGRKLYALEPIGLTPQDVPAFDAVYNQIEEAIAQFN